MEQASSSSSKVNALPQHQVFVNFRGDELRLNFVSHLRNAFVRDGVNIFIDSNEEKGKPLNVLFDRIQESRIALAIFSERYPESKWCLDELVKMKDCMDTGKLLIIPIFYKVKAYEVRFQRGQFGSVFNKKRHVDIDKKKQWSEALNIVADRFGFCFTGMSDENNFINDIVKEVKEALSKIPLDGTETPPMSFGREKDEIYGLRQRLEELEEKLDLDCQETRLLGIVGMPGIGKTTLARELYENWHPKFLSHGLIQDIRRTSKELGPDCLLTLLVEELLGVRIQDTESIQSAFESYKSQLNAHKVLIVLDDVSDEKQIKVLLGTRDWVRKGSRIVIATSDKSLIQDMVDYTYVVPQLNHNDGLGHFRRYAFDHHSNIHNNEVIMKLSKEFVHYARGHPLALQLLGVDLKGKDEDHWKTKLATLAQSSSSSIRDVLQGQHRLWHIKDITDVLNNIEEGAEVRGIFLNMNEMEREMCLDSCTFESMHDLRYLKIYSSHCPQQCKSNSMINLPDGLNLPLEKVRYLHWVEFPLKEIPPDFNPHNLVDLKLPYSKIEQIWSDDKDTSKLKWVDLNHSSSLRVLTGLSKAQNLQRLNLEGLACLMTTQQNYSTFVFTNCNKLERSAKDDISSFAQWKCQLLSDAPNSCNVSDSEALFSTCFPGSELPSWFCHEAVGSALELKMPPHCPTMASLKFTVIDDTSEIPRLEVLKCGLRFFTGVGSNGNYLKKLEVKEAEQNQSVEKVSENWPSESDNRCKQSPESVITEVAESVAASPEESNNPEYEAEIIITPREAQPGPCSKTSKWACFACCDFQEL
ncbi:hypothetical protein AALP_AA5G140300 [Arabis alpina]|uniref:TIR domain-containing protein n=1 Tax=Arabis alpina TaxID=50452 RepID=A0A087GWZ9_ARAAL|nr:hypothetical protein AALP_AA5G140300 [Arabis alpina]